MKSILVFVATLAVAPSAMSQFCFRGRPADRCDTFLVLEFGLLSAFENESQHSPVNAAFWELGMMKNLSDGNHALGGSVYISYDDTNFRNLLWGVKARGRKWITRTVAVDVEPGILLGQDAQFDSGVDLRLPGFTGRVSIGYADLVALTLGVDAYRLDIIPELQNVSSLRDERVTWYFGIRLGSYAGVGSGVVGAALISVAQSIADS